MKFHVKRGPANSKDQGYVLLGLLLMLCMLVIAAAVVAPTLAFEIKRDREEEFIHRGVQYSRAVRLFAKSTGRYPLGLDELNGKNGVRYIRRLYKDPITGKDFKLLHMKDIMTASGTNVPQNGQPVQSEGDNSADPTNQNSSDAAAGQQNNSTNNTASNSGSQPSSPQSSSQSPGARFAAAASNTSATSAQPGLGVIFGVVSASKQKTIREFEHKNHYDQWLFFYDPSHETGFLATGPTPMTMPVTGQVGAPAAGAPSPAFGQPAATQQQPPTPPPATN